MIDADLPTCPSPSAATMSMPRRRVFRAISAAAVGGLAGLAGATSHAAEPYPSKPIRLLVPFPPGGATDLVARMLAKTMGDLLGQPFVIENRAGAGATIAASTVANAEPDGYTLLVTTAGVHVVNPAIYSKLPYDPVKSWAPIGQFIAVPLGVLVPASSPLRTLEDLVEYAKRNPGKLTYGTPGNGTGPHLAGALFAHATGTELLHVPYRGAGPAMVDFKGGRLDMMFPYLGTVKSGIDSGEYRLLAFGSSTPVPAMPDVPLIGQRIGQPDFNSDTWNGMAAPAGTPPEVISRLNAALNQALEKHRAELTESGYLVLPGTPQDMQQRIERELRDVTPLLRRLIPPVN